jgi:hypothetical protein
MRWFWKSFSGFRVRPAFSAHTFNPALHSVLIAIPPLAPVTITITSNTIFGISLTRARVEVEVFGILFVRVLRRLGKDFSAGLSNSSNSLNPISLL